MDTRARISAALEAHGQGALERAAWDACDNEGEYKDTALALMCALGARKKLATRIREEADPHKALTVLANARRPKNGKDSKMPRQVVGRNFSKRIVTQVK